MCSQHSRSLGIHMQAASARVTEGGMGAYGCCGCEGRALWGCKAERQGEERVVEEGKRPTSPST